MERFLENFKKLWKNRGKKNEPRGKMGKKGNKKEKQVFCKPKHNNSSLNVNKTSILIGLNYPGSHYSLNGCVNDVKNGDLFLKDHGYNSKFLDDSKVTDSYNVLEALEELRNSNSEYVFFHYSGHGTRQVDKDGDEEDGMDEVIYSKNGKMITDDEINQALSLFSEDKTIFLVFDCCHSGTIADLAYICTDHGYSILKNPKHLKAKIICLSGCKDFQTSADITEGSISYGALYSTLYKILRNNKTEITWSELHKQLKLEMSFKKYTQIPQLTASDPDLFNEIVKF